MLIYIGVFRILAFSYNVMIAFVKGLVIYVLKTKQKGVFHFKLITPVAKQLSALSLLEFSAEMPPLDFQPLNLFINTADETKFINFLTRGFYK